MKLKPLLLAAPVLILGLVLSSPWAVEPRSEPTQPVLMTAATEPVLYTGPTTDSHAELTRALQKATDDWFRAMQAAREQEQAVAAAVAMEAAARRPHHPQVVSAPSTDSAPTPSGGGSAEDAVSMYFGDIFSQAWGVSGCESGHNPAAVSPGGGNWGLFQINTAHKKSFPAVTGHPWSDVLDPYLNAQFARWLYDNSGGWGPWSCKWAAR